MRMLDGLKAGETVADCKVRAEGAPVPSFRHPACSDGGASKGSAP